MDAIELFRSRYLDLHGRILPAIRDGLDEESIRLRSTEELNPIGWIIWHVGRSEDVGLNRLVGDRSQVLDEQWDDRFGLVERSAGTGMSRDQVDRFCATVSIEPIWDYLSAVHSRTLSILDEIDARRLSERVGRDEVENVMIGEGVLYAGAHHFLDLYVDQPRGWFLSHLGLAHSYYHLGQLVLAKKLWAIRR